MSGPANAAAGRPLRTAGVVLLGIAAIMGLIGLIGALGGGGAASGDDGSGVAAPGTSSNAGGAGDRNGGGAAGDGPPPPGIGGAPGAPDGPRPGAPGPDGGQAGVDGDTAAGGSRSGVPDSAGDTDGPAVPGQVGADAVPEAEAPADGAASPGPAGGAVRSDGARFRAGRAPSEATQQDPKGTSRLRASAGEETAPRPRAPLRVYNNSNIEGLAARAAADFRAAGWTVVAVGNYSGGIIPTSTVYYQPGRGQRPAAEALGEEFGLRVLPRFPGIRDATPGLIVIVTKSYSG